MASIDLPRAIQDYFAFAETTATRNGRRFSITLPYQRPDGRLDKLQWWYHLSPAKEKALGDRAPEALRAEAIARFKVHIERWLQNTEQIMYGDRAIPQVALEAERRMGDQCADDGHGEPEASIEEPSGPVWLEHEDADCAEMTQGDVDALEPIEADKSAFG
jgi:hypothetical protein